MSNFFKQHHAPLSIVVAAIVALGAIFAMPNIDTAGVTSMSAAGLLMSLMRFAVAVSLLFVVLRVLDMISDFNWPVISHEIEHDPRAAALYLGLRILAIAWIASACFS